MIYNNDLKSNILIGGWLVLFLAVIFAYAPGLKGPFVLDDFSTIVDLGNLGGVNDWESFTAFVFGGHSGPTGRPLALLTFLIDANNWPTDPWPFKRTNLIVHLINGALLGALIAQILNLLDFDRKDARWIALLSAACWLLHPFLVSTTLYAVQRMAQLSTMFIFMGLFAYLHFRSFVVTRPTKAYVGMSLSIATFTFLSMISKENGILLPLLCGVAEATIVASRRQHFPPLNRYWIFTLIILPSMVIAIYLGAKIFGDRFFETAARRDFSSYERTLTQPRVLFDYLRHWFVPELYTTGVFQDHFIKSTGLLSPVTTLLSAMLHFAVISIAIVKRRKWPLFAFAALFFYASHVLESTVLNLELYFEHRNYLAAAFLFVPVVVLLREKVSRHLFIVGMTSALLLFTGFTRYSATIWADYPSMVEASAHKAPTSARAQTQYAIDLYNAQRYEEALQVFDDAIQNVPVHRPLLLVNRLTMLCNRDSLTANEFERVSGVLSGLAYDPRSVRVYLELTSAVFDGRCPALSADNLRPMFVNMLQVSQNSSPQSLAYSEIKYFIGLTDIQLNHPARAVAAFEESLQANLRTDHAMTMANQLASNGYFEEALYMSGKALTQVEAAVREGNQTRRVSENEIMQFQAAMRSEMDAARGDD